MGTAPFLSSWKLHESLFLAVILVNVLKSAVEKHRKLPKISKGKPNIWIYYICFMKKAFMAYFKFFFNMLKHWNKIEVTSKWKKGKWKFRCVYLRSLSQGAERNKSTKACLRCWIWEDLCIKWVSGGLFLQDSNPDYSLRQCVSFLDVLGWGRGLKGIPWTFGSADLYIVSKDSLHHLFQCSSDSWQQKAPLQSSAEHHCCF